MKLHGIATLAAIAAFAAACAEGEPPAEYETMLDSIPPTEEVAPPLGEPVPGEERALGTATLEDGSTYLTDSEGRALYLFTADARGSNESACYDACAEAWPPVLADEGMPTTEMAGLDPSLLGTIERRDGSQQVTYNGWPLYRYAGDTGPGMTTGQDVHDAGGEWYLVTPEGEQLETSGS